MNGRLPLYKLAIQEVFGRKKACLSDVNAASGPKKCTLPFISVQRTLYPALSNSL